MENNSKNFEETKRATAHVMEQHEKIKDHPLRQKYHFEVPAGWCNDPNGFSVFRGKYHLFYQHNPYMAEPGDYRAYWGHAISENLVDWEYLPIVLAPVDAYDKAGCWSGCALELEDKMYIMYTGLDERNERQQGQCMAVSEDGIYFEKTDDNPILAETLCSADKKDFRDPCIWRENGEWNMVIGSTKDNFAQTLLYRSEDLKNWKFVNTMTESLGELGTVCECPNFFQLGEKRVLFTSPHGLNHRKSVYLTGDFDYPAGKFFWNNYGEIDWGMDYYAPQVITDKKGRKIIIGWMNSWDWMPWCDGKYYTTALGWCGAMAIPREVRMDREGNLSFMPIEELQKYRSGELVQKDITVGEEGISVETGDNAHCEIIMELDLKKTTAKTVRLELKSDGKEKALVNFNLTRGEIEFDRSSTLDRIKCKRKAPFRSVIEDTCKIHLFIDSSSIEIFTDHYRTCMTNTVYVPKDATGIKIYGMEGTAKIPEIQSWVL